MNRFPTKKLAAIPADIGERIAIVQLSNAEREAALKMPIKDAMRELSRRTQEELDEHQQLMIEAYLDADLTDPSRQVQGRLTMHADPVYQMIEGVLTLVPAEDRGDTYAMDGTAILWAGPVRMERRGEEGSEEMTAQRSIRYYLKPRGEAANDVGPNGSGV